MSDYVTLTCPSCGGSLQITKDTDRFACAHCGNEHVVRRGGGIVALEPVVKKLTGIKIGVDKTASELAIKRLKEEIKALEYEITSQKEKHKALLRVEGSLSLGVLLIILSSAGLLLGVLNWFSTDTGSVFIFPSLLGGAVGVMLYKSGKKTYNDAIKRGEKIETHIVEELSPKLKQKQAELKKHEEIVSKNV